MTTSLSLVPRRLPAIDPDERPDWIDPANHQESIQIVLAILDWRHTTGSWPCDFASRMESSGDAFDMERQVMYAEDDAQLREPS